MVAYQNRIFVYRPRTFPTQFLPKHPDVQLLSKPTEDGALIGGCIDRTQPHTINNIKIGYLGHEEILVSAHDNGDVNIYHTRVIQALVRRKLSQGLAGEQLNDDQLFPDAEIPPLKTFNSGLSAWGLRYTRNHALWLSARTSMM